MKNILLLALIITFVIIGCAPIQPTFEDSNQYFLEKTIDKLNLGEQIKDKIPNGSKVAFVSIEEDETLDEPIIAMIEDQIVQSLVNNGFIVVQRDEDAIQKLIREKEDNYFLTYKQSTEGMMFEKVSGDMVKTGLNFIETQLTSADYVILYRILEAGILYREDNDIVNSEVEIREGLVRLSVTIQGAQTGEIIYANNLSGKLEDKINKQFISQLASFHYSFFPYKYPLQPKKKIEKLKEIKQAYVGSWFISSQFGMGGDFWTGETAGLFGFNVGYGDDSWGNISLGFTDYNDNVITNFMLVYEKSYRNILFNGGIGSLFGEWRGKSGYCSGYSNYSTEYSCENANHYWYDSVTYNDVSSLGVKLGLGYQFPIGKYVYIKPRYDLYWGLSEERLRYHGISFNIGLTK